MTVLLGSSRLHLFSQHCIIHFSEENCPYVSKVCCMTNEGNWFVILIIFNYNKSFAWNWILLWYYIIFQMTPTRLLHFIINILFPISHETGNIKSNMFYQYNTHEGCIVCTPVSIILKICHSIKTIFIIIIRSII